MRVHIFDVEHGECSAIETPSGELVFIGLGHNSTTGWRPSSWVKARNQKPGWIVLSNLDRDHLSDIESFEPHLRPSVIVRNRHISPDWIRRLKIKESGEVHRSVETALHWMGNVFTGESISPNFGMETRFFYHSTEKFQDTNNLSVVTFTQFNNCGILFPGDLETAGWSEFLKDPTFVDCLKRTNVLIASHHGRIGGYCGDIFSICRPAAVIVSDKPILHDTQDHDCYETHCSGVDFNGTLRKVLTTRCDGKITIDIPQAGQALIHLNQAY